LSFDVNVRALLPTCNRFIGDICVWVLTLTYVHCYPRAIGLLAKFWFEFWR